MTTMGKRMMGHGPVRATGLATWLVAALMVVCGQAAVAGGFSVSPVRLFLSERDRAVALRLSNEGDEELVLHTDVQAWTQDSEGRDRLEPSEDLIVSPPLLRIAPRAEQVVRLVMAAPRRQDQQMSYRLFVREPIREPIREASRDPTGEAPDSRGPGSKTAQVPIALVLSLPVFVTPKQARHELNCRLETPPEEWPMSTPGKTEAHAVCENTGNAHARLGRLDLNAGPDLLARFEGNLYLLPGARRRVTLTADSRHVLPSAPTPWLLQALLDRDETVKWPVGGPLMVAR